MLENLNKGIKILVAALGLFLINGAFNKSIYSQETSEPA